MGFPSSLYPRLVPCFPVLIPGTQTRCQQPSSGIMFPFPKPFQFGVAPLKRKATIFPPETGPSSNERWCGPIRFGEKPPENHLWGTPGYPILPPETGRPKRFTVPFGLQPDGVTTVG